MVAISPNSSGLSEADNKTMSGFAEMTGDAAVVPAEAPKQGGASLQAAESVDDDDEPIPDILDTRTKPSPIQSPMSKFVLVAGGCAVLAFIAGFVMIGMTSGPATKTVTAKAPEPALSAAKDGAPVNPKELESASGSLKTTAALATQDRDLAAINESLKKGKKPGTTGAIAPGSDTQKVGTVSDAKPGNDATVTVPPAPTPAPEPVYQTSPILPAAPEPLISQTAIAPPVDGNAEWQRISKMGSYGMVPVSMAVMPAPTPVAAAPVSPSQAARPVAATPSTTPSLLSYMSGTGARVNQAYAQIGMAPTNQVQRRVLVGTRVPATLLTDAVWAGNGNQPTFGGDAAAPKFIVKLNQPVTDTSGAIVIPADALLVTVIRPLEQGTGMADMNVVSVIIGNQEYQPPAGALTIRGADGGAIVADKFDKGQQVAGLDFSLIATSALSSMGAIMNQASTTQSISGVGTATTVTTTPPPNYFGAAMQGGFGALADTLKKRNEAAVNQIISRPDVFYVPQGKMLQLFVNQSINF